MLYGDELGMKHLPNINTSDLMKWDSSNLCGFSTLNKTLVLNRLSDKNCNDNAQIAFAHGAGQTLAQIYKELAKLRQEPSFQWGQITTPMDKSNTLITFVREAKGFKGYLVAINFSTNKSLVVYEDLPVNGIVKYFYTDPSTHSKQLIIGAEVVLSNILLKPGEMIVVEFDRAETPASAEKTNKVGH